MSRKFVEKVLQSYFARHFLQELRLATKCKFIHILQSVVCLINKNDNKETLKQNRANSSKDRSGRLKTCDLLLNSKRDIYAIIKIIRRYCFG